LRVLSGGERGRLMLARSLAKPSNMLVLDEPTNDLDLETLDVLEEMLGDYPGTILLISHDRDFLDRVVNAVIVPEGQGRWIEYAGGYTDMLAQRGADIAGRAVEKARPTKAAKAGAATGPPPPARAERKRLNFNQQHALKTLPGRIATLEAAIGALQDKLGDAQLYARDQKAFAELSAALAKAQADLDAAEAEWLELEMLREEIEGG
jgi:ATP-binding cassette subfamily F protein uup